MDDRRKSCSLEIELLEARFLPSISNPALALNTDINAGDTSTVGALAADSIDFLSTSLNSSSALQTGSSSFFASIQLASTASTRPSKSGTQVPQVKVDPNEYLKQTGNGSQDPATSATPIDQIFDLSNLLMHEEDFPPARNATASSGLESALVLNVESSPSMLQSFSLPGILAFPNPLLTGRGVAPSNGMTPTHLGTQRSEDSTFLDDSGRVEEVPSSPKEMTFDGDNCYNPAFPRGKIPLQGLNFEITGLETGFKGFFAHLAQLTPDEESPSNWNWPLCLTSAILLAGSAGDAILSARRRKRPAGFSLDFSHMEAEDLNATERGG